MSRKPFAGDTAASELSLPRFAFNQRVRCVGQKWSVGVEGVIRGIEYVDPVTTAIEGSAGQGWAYIVRRDEDDPDFRHTPLVRLDEEDLALVEAEGSTMDTPIALPPSVPPPRFTLFQTVTSRTKAPQAPLTVCGLVWVDEEADWQNEDPEPGWLYAVGDASSLVSEQSLTAVSSVETALHTPRTHWLALSASFAPRPLFGFGAFVPLSQTLQPIRGVVFYGRVLGLWFADWYDTPCWEYMIDLGDHPEAEANDYRIVMQESEIIAEVTA